MIVLQYESRKHFTRGGRYSNFSSLLLFWWEAAWEVLEVATCSHSLCVLNGSVFYCCRIQDPSCGAGSSQDFCGLGEALFMIGGIFLIAGSVITAIVGSIIVKLSSRRTVQASVQKICQPCQLLKNNWVALYIIFVENSFFILFML